MLYQLKDISNICHLKVPRLVRPVFCIVDTLSISFSDIAVENCRYTITLRTLHCWREYWQRWTMDTNRFYGFIGTRKRWRSVILSFCLELHLEEILHRQDVDAFQWHIRLLFWLIRWPVSLLGISATVRTYMSLLEEEKDPRKSCWRKLPICSHVSRTSFCKRKYGQQS